MTTIATAGFSTHDASIAYFDNIAIERIMIVGMILSGIPFVLYIQMLRGKTLLIWKDTQVQWFMIMIIVAVLATTLWLILSEGMGIAHAFRIASFNSISIMTTSGFVSSDYNTWGSFAVRRANRAVMEVTLRALSLWTMPCLTMAPAQWMS